MLALLAAVNLVGASRNLRSRPRCALLLRGAACVRSAWIAGEGPSAYQREGRHFLERDEALSLANLGTITSLLG